MAAVPAIAAPAPAASTPASREDAWPSTSRTMPWLIAAFLVLLWLTPIAAIKLPIDLPIDARPDRLFLVLLLVTWFFTSFAPGRLGVERRASGVHWALGLFLAITLAGLLIRWPEIVLLGENQLAIKKTLLLIAYGVFFLVTVSSLRAADVPRLAMLIAVLAALTGLGTLAEYATGFNVFYRGAELLLPGFSVEFAPSGVLAGRKVVVGPTAHGLAVTTILALALPFALTYAVRAQGLGRRLLWAMAIGCIIAGALATSRKTAVVAPLVAVTVFAAYRPRIAVRLLPVVLIAAGVVVLAARQPLDDVVSLLSGSGTDAASTAGRLADYDALRPDLLTHLLLGRGYGTYDPLIYRILDNTFLGLLVSVGVLGTLAFLLTIIATIRSAHASTRSADPLRADLGAAIVAGMVTFLVVSILFDSIGFVPVPYLVMFLSACAVVLAREPTTCDLDVHKFRSNGP